MKSSGYIHYTAGYGIDEDELQRIENFHITLLNTLRHFKADVPAKELQTFRNFVEWLYREVEL